jgi:hypothetical protein
MEKRSNRVLVIKVIKFLMIVFVFPETMLQAFTIDSEGQRVAISSEKVGFLAADPGPGFLLLYI